MPGLIVRMMLLTPLYEPLRVWNHVYPKSHQELISTPNWTTGVVSHGLEKEACSPQAHCWLCRGAYL